MDAQDGTRKFKEADGYFQEGKYHEALNLLLELNRAYPNTKNLLYPIVLSLEKLGRGTVAIPICDQLIERFDDERAKEIKLRLLAPHSDSNDDHAAAPDEADETPEKKARKSRAQERLSSLSGTYESSSRKRKPVIAGVIVLLAVLVLSVLVYAYIGNMK